MSKTQVIFCKALPRLDYKNSILIFDQRLFVNNSSWIKHFKNRYAVASGEKLKNVEIFPKHIKKILYLADGIEKNKLTVVAFGGGSVGDFSGFVASILKRGARLIHIPSTWLSAMDSSHGGKTALNVRDFKNQIGTFYPAEKTFVVKNVLLSQPEERLRESLGEYYKMCLIAGGKLWRRACQEKNVTSDFLWSQLPTLIREKEKITQQDLLEKKNIRHRLNLGHTVGHILEANNKIPHGDAVRLGTKFTLEMAGTFDYPEWMFPSVVELKKQMRKVRSPIKFLIKDKKILAKRKIKFVLVRQPGRVYIKEIPIKNLLTKWNQIKNAK